MDEMKRAMKEKDTITLNTIRLIRSSFANAVIELKLNKEENAKLNDLEAQNVLKKLAKMRKEAIDMYETNGAPDRAMIERNELAIISKWLPEVVTEDTLRQWVQAAIQTATSTTKAPLNMGKVMGLLMKEHKNDNMDGNMAQTIVKEEIAKLSAST